MSLSGTEALSPGVADIGKGLLDVSDIVPCLVELAQACVAPHPSQMDSVLRSSLCGGLFLGLFPL